MVYSYNSNRPYQEFRMKVFRFFNDYNAVYLHCELLACHRSSRNSRLVSQRLHGNHVSKLRIDLFVVKELSTPRNALHPT